tara:strand:+ start:1146 stop:1520 length:375 start_codon:yes stop_codon:yes gene_type:complete
MSFAKSLSIADEINAEVGREARALGINLLNGLTRVTPVDTGRARGNWFVGINKSNRSIDQERKAAQAIIDGVNDVQSSKALNYPEIVLSNNLPYIERLNEGYSLQAPKKFIESEIDRVVNASNR